MQYIFHVINFNELSLYFIVGNRISIKGLMISGRKYVSKRHCTVCPWKSWKVWVISYTKRKAIATKAVNSWMKGRLLALEILTCCKCLRVKSSIEGHQNQFACTNHIPTLATLSCHCKEIGSLGTVMCPKLRKSWLSHRQTANCCNHWLEQASCLECPDWDWR